jgi:teichuronic acid biosynthesis glycosyltransferase TuaC
MSERHRMRGLLFAKQYPNSAEPSRGTFNATQVAATSPWVDWRVIAPVPWGPAWPPLRGRPRADVFEFRDGVPVAHPRFFMPPRHIAYMRVADWMVRASRASVDQAIREHSPGFIHGHALYPSGAAAAMVARATGLPLVITVHGSDLYALSERDEWRARIAEVASAADRIVCVSGALATDVSCLLGVPSERVSVVPDAYDEARFSYVARRAPGPGRVRLVCVARLVEVKGVHLLLEAVGQLVADGLDASLVVVGDGPLRPQLAATAARMGIAGRVQFSGGLPPERVPLVLTEADIYVQPSLREGFGLALVEAMATGLPVVATRSGGPEETVGHGDGVLVHAGDADALASGLREAVDRLTTFDRVAIADRVRSLYARGPIGVRLADVYRGLGTPPTEEHGA